MAPTLKHDSGIQKGSFVFMFKIKNACYLCRMHGCNDNEMNCNNGFFRKGLCANFYQIQCPYREKEWIRII